MGSGVSRVDGWGLAVFAAVVVIPFLGSFGLLEPDEGRFAQIGREMAANGNFLVPHLNGIEQFYKPPLVYWLNAVFYKMMAKYRDWETDRKSTRLNSSHSRASRMPSSA